MIAEHLNTTMKKAGNELHTACFVCGGTDRFIITPSENRAWCRRCNWRGDEISLVMALHNVGYKEACERLGKTPRPPQQTAQRPTRPTMTASKPRTQTHDVTAWRACAQRLLDRANDVFHDEDADGVATRWLASRGLDTIRAVCGYIPVSFNSNWGGLEVHIPSGFLLAWYDHPDANPYKLNIRRLDPKPNETKYHMVKGSENGLYNAHLIPLKPIVVLVEGELDALSIMQGTCGHVYAVATGSTTGGRLQKYIAMLATRKTVLVAFDADEPGEQASRYWLDLLPNGKRLVPLAHDPNDMLKQGMDFMQWIRSAL